MLQLVVTLKIALLRRVQSLIVAGVVSITLRKISVKHINLTILMPDLTIVF